MQAARLLANLSVVQRNGTENEKNGLTEKELEMTRIKTRLFSSVLLPVTENNVLEENREEEEMEQVNFQFLHSKDREKFHNSNNVHLLYTSYTLLQIIVSFLGHTNPISHRRDRNKGANQPSHRRDRNKGANQPSHRRDRNKGANQPSHRRDRNKGAN